MASIVPDPAALLNPETFKKAQEQLNSSLQNMQASVRGFGRQARGYAEGLSVEYDDKPKLTLLERLFASVFGAKPSA